MSIIYEDLLTTTPRIETMPERPPSPMLPSLLVARYAAKKPRQAPPAAAKTAKKARQAPPAAKKKAKKARQAPSVAKKTARSTARRRAPDGELRMPVPVVASILKRFHAPFSMHNGMTSPEDASRLVQSSHEKRKTFVGLVACKLREAKTDL